MSTRANLKSRKSALGKTVTAKGTVVFSAYPKRLEDVPLEYQAAVYAKKQRDRLAKQDVQKRTQLEKLRATVKALKEKLRSVRVESARAELEREIATHQKAMRKTPKSRRKWSPILSGSFEAGKQK
ncbi:hypothetical protein [Zoogloea sp. 1C4]|uniref:hypothetical protein n=1 Tax=Zoogloea sp. 1C4 TaxID=2570190 RepID=UPI001291D2B1|nr:hypothetical protein [Zoogloea sp. 1C4]